MLDSLSYSDLRVYCKNNDLNMDNMLRTLPDYPNEKRRNKIYRGYHIIGINDNQLNSPITLRNEKVNVPINDSKEIDFTKGRIRAEKIIHLNVDNINEKDILKEFNLDNKDDRHALYLDDCRDITIDKVKTISHLSESAYIRTNNVENLMIRGFSTENALPSFLENSGKSSGIKLIGNDFSKVSQLYNEEIGQEVKEAGNLFENK